MEDQPVDLDDHAEATDDKTANRGARPGATAKGGTAAKAGDPTSPAQAADRSAPVNAAMTKAGFGDHKGEDFGRDGTGSR